MIITIEGKINEGKTSLAKKIIGEKKTYRIQENNLKSPFWSSGLDDSFDFILIDDVKNYNNVYSIFSCELIAVNKPFCFESCIKTPDVIIVKI